MNTKDRIKQLAAQRKITIAELERKLHIANGTIGKWDKQNPSIEPLKKLADYFGVTTDYLLGRTDTLEFNKKEPYVAPKFSPKRSSLLKNTVATKPSEV